MRFTRNKFNFITSWWWTVDRISVVTILSLVVIGLFLVATSSPAVAERLGLESLYFFYRHIFFTTLGLLSIFIVSFLPREIIKRLALLGFVIGIILLFVVLVSGVEVKGAKRWVNIYGFSLQPSEFIKPFFIVVTAWLLSLKHKTPGLPSFSFSVLVYTCLAGLIIMQPDFGMTMIISMIWGAQLFIAGLSFLWIFAGMIFIIIFAIGSYMFLPHVTKRIDSFLHPDMTENYQISKSIEAFMNGGLYGSGPGEGVVKQHIPDSHTDFIFAVAGEELGLIACSVIIIIYSIIVIRGFYILKKENDIFVVLSVVGILTQFGLQSIINIGVNINLLPTKGMTLPLISYGGSSTLSMALSLGIMLALTKKKYGYHNYHQESINNIKCREIA